MTTTTTSTTPPSSTTSTATSASAASHRRESLRFGHVTIEYDERVLRPRPWTQVQSLWAVELLEGAAPGPVLELCSGAGHIGLLAATSAGRDLVAVDVDPTACYFTALNAEGAGHAHRVDVRNAPMQRALEPGERFALALADPPWVTTAGIGEFPEDPRLAIDGGPDGLDLARACLATCSGHLEPGGSVLLQLGTDDQADALLAEHLGGGSGTWVDGGRRYGSGGMILRLVPTGR